MEDALILEKMNQLILEMAKAFDASHGQTNDDHYLSQDLIDVQKEIKCHDELDNTVLFAVEKFHKKVSTLLGLSTIETSQEFQDTWRSFDQFYSQDIQTRLKVGGANFFGV